MSRLFRFRLITLFCIVVIAAIGVRLWQRHEQLSRLSAEYARASAEHERSESFYSSLHRVTQFLGSDTNYGRAKRYRIEAPEHYGELADCHRQLSAKYRNAAENPWIEVSANPPRPTEHVRRAPSSGARCQKTVETMLQLVHNIERFRKRHGKPPSASTVLTWKVRTAWGDRIWCERLPNRDWTALSDDYILGATTADGKLRFLYYSVEPERGVECVEIESVP